MNNHPMNPPEELVQQWRESKILLKDALVVAAQWGADQELEATLGLMETLNIRGVDYVRNARRPKPPTLKEQALEQLRDLQQCGAGHRDTDKIRQALESL